MDIMVHGELIDWLFESEHHFAHSNGRIYRQWDVALSGVFIPSYDRVIEVSGNFYIAKFEKGVWKPDYSRQIHIGGIV